MTVKATDQARFWLKVDKSPGQGPHGDVCDTEFANANLFSAAPELYAELFLARDAVAETRRCIFESHTVRDDPVTLEDEVKPEIERLDAQLARIDAALRKAAP